MEGARIDHCFRTDVLMPVVHPYEVELLGYPIPGWGTPHPDLARVPPPHLDLAGVSPHPHLAGLPPFPPPPRV